MDMGGAYSMVAGIREPAGAAAFSWGPTPGLVPSFK